MVWVHSHRLGNLPCERLPIEPPHYIVILDTAKQEIKRVLEPIEDEI